MVFIQGGHPSGSSTALQRGGNPNSELHDQESPCTTYNFDLRGDAYGEE